MPRKVSKRSDVRQRRRAGPPERALVSFQDLSPELAALLPPRDVKRDDARWSSELGRVQQDDAPKTTSITFDADALDARVDRAVGFVRRHPERAEALVRNLAARLELALQVLEVERRWRVQRTAKATAIHAKPKPTEDLIVAAAVAGVKREAIPVVLLEAGHQVSRATVFRVLRERGLTRTK